MTVRRNVLLAKFEAIEEADDDSIGTYLGIVLITVEFVNTP